MSSYVLWKLDPALSVRDHSPVPRSGDTALTASERAELRKKQRAGGSGRRVA